MSGPDAIVGVDVGGTFTDLFLLDSGRAARSAPPRCPRVAATRRKVSSTACARSAACPPSARSCTAPRSAPTRCWNGAGRRSASSRRAASATCWRCAGATAARTWGLWGDFVPIADRDMRHRGRRAHARRRHAFAPRSMPTRCAPRQSNSARPARRRSRSSSSTPMPMPTTSAARSPRCARSGRTSMSRASHEVLSEIREFERSSTAALNAYLQPVVGAYIGKLEARARTAELRRPIPHRAVERRHHVDRDRAPAAGAHRAVRSGRGRGRGRGARQGRGLRQSHHLRSRRHLVRCVR